ncbi:unnamed protein product [Dibothriocephalus latus]|uniref:SET domain-containing protein n=1 Tax=Dibothriocephalus latus TaxID=60516 RepID=A0A3P6UAH5_DIBLA|nr:unnamed protein product [Dibothriocephalus latus]
MAPHLMDLPLAKVSSITTSSVTQSSPTVSRVELGNSKNTAISTSTKIPSPPPKEASTTSAPSRHNKTTPKVFPPVSKLSHPPIIFDLADATAGLSEPKKTLFGAWHAKAAATGGTLVVQQRWKDQEPPAVLRYNKVPPKMVEDMELRYDPEMKIFEVPDDICVSPSQLSGLDSDSSDEESSQLPPANQLQNSLGSSAQPGSVVRCACGFTVQTCRRIQCTTCKLYQHHDCMETVFSDSKSSVEDASVGQVCQSTVFSQLQAGNYKCYKCSSRTITPTLLEKLRVNMQQRLSANLLSGLDQGNLHTASVPPCSMSSAQVLANATDRARQLGLIVDSHSLASDRLHGDVGEIPSTCSKPGEDGVLCWREAEDPDVNLAIPSPPRASKRKQDLSTTSYADSSTVNTRKPPISGLQACKSADSLSGPSTPSTIAVGGSSQTPDSLTPRSTPGKSYPLSYNNNLRIYSPTTADTSVAAGASSTTSENATPENSPLVHRQSANLSAIGHRKRPRRSLFLDLQKQRSEKRAREALPNSFGAAWAKNYQEASRSTYTNALFLRIAERIASGRERDQRLPPTCLDRSPLCRLVLFDHNDKGLESSVCLSRGDVVTELRGRIMLMEEYEHYVDPTAEYNRYVILYNDFGDTGVAIDATQFGNDARFIRRSCTPNCKLDHFIVCGKMHIVIRTIQTISPGVELTIPFDVDYKSCRYPLDCACARSRCPVLKWRRKLVRNKVMPNLDYSKCINSKLKELSKLLSDDGSHGFAQLDFSGSATNSPAKSDTMSPSLTRRPVIGAAALLSPQRFSMSMDLPSPAGLKTNRYSVASTGSPSSSTGRQLFSSPTRPSLPAEKAADSPNRKTSTELTGDNKVKPKSPRLMPPQTPTKEVSVPPAPAPTSEPASAAALESEPSWSLRPRKRSSRQSSGKEDSGDSRSKAPASGSVAPVSCGSLVFFLQWLYVSFEFNT